MDLTPSTLKKRLNALNEAKQQGYTHPAMQLEIQELEEQLRTATGIVQVFECPKCIYRYEAEVRVMEIFCSKGHSPVAMKESWQPDTLTGEVDAIVEKFQKRRRTSLASELEHIGLELDNENKSSDES